MGFPNRRKVFREVAEIIVYIKRNADDLHLCLRLASLLCDKIEAIRDDVAKSAEGLRSNESFVQADDLEEIFEWTAFVLEITQLMMRAETKEDLLDNLADFEKATEGTLPVVKRCRLDIQKLLSPTPEGEKQTEAVSSKVVVQLNRNFRAKVRIKNPDEYSQTKWLTLNWLLVRSTLGFVVEERTDTMLVDLVLDDDLWPDADRENNIVEMDKKALDIL